MLPVGEMGVEVVKMGKTITILFTLILCSWSLFSHAAKPTSIKYVEEIVVGEDKVYAYYQVSCSNGDKKDISAWDNRKLWCLGKGGTDTCHKKQIKTAKKSCK